MDGWMDGWGVRRLTGSASRAVARLIGGSMDGQGVQKERERNSGEMHLDISVYFLNSQSRYEE